MNPLTQTAQNLYGKVGGSPADIQNVVRNVYAENLSPTVKNIINNRSTPYTTIGGGVYGPAGDYLGPAQTNAPAAQTSQPDYSGQALAAISRSADLLNQRENAAITNLDREVAQQRKTLQSNVQTGQERLTRQRETATRQRNQGLRELSQNISNAFRAGMNRLANAGAGDSSATKMYQIALGQQEAQNRGQLLSDFGYNIGNIELATKQLERDYQTKLDNLEGWKQSQLFNIRDTFLRNRDALEQQRASLGGAYVSQATAQLAQTAANNLANLSDQVGSASQVIQNNFAEAAAQLKDLNRANINPNVALQTR